MAPAIDPVAVAVAAAKPLPCCYVADAAQAASDSSRFENETDAINHAQNSGQGALTVGAVTERSPIALVRRWFMIQLET